MSINQYDLLKVLREAVAAPWLTLCAAYVFLAMNVVLAPGLRAHDGQRLAQIAVLATAGCLLLLPKHARALAGVWLLWPLWMRNVLLLVLVLGLCSSAFAALPRWALLECLTFLLLTVLALGVASAWRASGVLRDHALTTVFYATALAYSVKAITVYVTMIAIGPAYDSGFAEEHLGFAVEELFTGFSNVRFFSQVQTMLLPFLLIPAMCWGRTPVQRLLLFIVPAIWWMLLVASGTRGTWVAMLIAAVLAAVCCGAAGRRWLNWQIFGLIAGLVLYALLIIVLPGLLLSPDIQELPSSVISRRGEITSLRGREDLWQLSWTLISAHPLLGIGPMHFAQRLTDIAAHPHNSLLQFAVEWGVPATLMLTAVLAVAALRWMSHLYRELTPAPPDFAATVKVALCAALCGAAVQSLVDGTLVMPVSQVTLALLAGWAIGSGLNFSPEQGTTSKSRTLSLRLLAVVAAIGLMVTVSPELGTLEQREDEHLKSLKPGPAPRMQPRYWTHGWIPD